MYLVQYDIKNDKKSKKAKGIQVRYIDKIESTYYPLACIAYPKKYLNKPSVLISNNNYKLKIWTQEKE